MPIFIRHSAGGLHLHLTVRHWMYARHLVPAGCALNCWVYKVTPRIFFGSVSATVSLCPYLCAKNSTTRSMRLFCILPVLSLLLGGRASSLDSRDSAPHRFDVRDTPDVCGLVNSEIVVPDILGILTAVGVIGKSTFSL